MGAEFITFEQFKTENNIPANATLSQILPSALGIADADSYGVPIVLKSTLTGNVAVGNWIIKNPKIATNAAETLVLGSDFQVYLEIRTPGFFDQWNPSGYAIAATTLKESLPQNYNLGFYRFVNYGVAAWDQTSTYDSVLYDFTLGEADCNRLYGGTAYWLFIYKDGNSKPTSASYCETITDGYTNYYNYAICDAMVAELNEIIYDAQGTPTPLSTPTGLYADQITSDSATISWNAVENATDYKVEYRRQGDTTWNE